MSDTLSCPSCDSDIDIGHFPVDEGVIRHCFPCNLTLIVVISEDDEAPHGGWASLREQTCTDCGRPSDPACIRCGGTGHEPAIHN